MLALWAVQCGQCSIRGSLFRSIIAKRMMTKPERKQDDKKAIDHNHRNGSGIIPYSLQKQCQ